MLDWRINNNKVVFSCGCDFDIIGDPIGKSKMPRIRVCSDLHNPNHTIRFGCIETWGLLSRGWSKGVFQLESPLGKTWVKKLKPTNKHHMAALGSILRPGSLRAKDQKLVCKECGNSFPIHQKETPKKEVEDYCPDCGSDDVKILTISMTEHYCLRKNLEEETPKYHPMVDQILSKSYNCLIYQEQSMLLARELAGFNLQEADVLRKAIGKKLPEEMAKVKKLFLERAKDAKIVSYEQAEEIFGWIEKSQRYSFNLSHAASYGETGYACAYAKTHFPLGFYRKWLEFAQDKQNPHEEIAELVNDARITSSIKIRPPDVRFRRDHVHSDGENIYFGLQDIKGIGDAQINKFKSALDELGIDKEQLTNLRWIDFLMLMGDKVSLTVMEGFIRAGALSYFKIDRVKMLKDYQIWCDLTPKEKKCILKSKAIINSIEDMLDFIISNKGYHTEKRAVVLVNILDGLVNCAYNIEDTIDYLVYSEEELLGVALTCHITDGIVGAMETCTCKDIVKGFKGYSVLKVTLDEVRTWKCKNGQSAGEKMVFIKASDNTCQLDNIVAFPEKYKEYAHLLNEDGIVYLSGKMGDKGSFIIERVYEHSEN